MEYRLNEDALLGIMEQWNRFLRKKVHLIACGGTAMTLIGAKASTKDVDFMVPNPAEHRYLTGVIQQLGYEQETGSGWKRKGDICIFDLFVGNKIHTTELLESPLLPENHTPLGKQFSRLYLGILNDYDLIAAKLFRGLGVDFEDCLELVRFRRGEIDIARLKRHYDEMCRYDINPDRICPHIDRFIELLREKELL